MIYNDLVHTPKHAYFNYNIAKDYLINKATEKEKEEILLKYFYDKYESVALCNMVEEISKEFPERLPEILEILEEYTLG